MTARQRGLIAAERQAQAVSACLRATNPAESLAFRKLARDLRRARAGKRAARGCAA